MYKVPIFFCQSGIVLIDTPGIGENAVMENVLLDYVQKKNVFGFVFVIKCNDSGGVLQRVKPTTSSNYMINEYHFKGQKIF